MPSLLCQAASISAQVFIGLLVVTVGGRQSISVGQGIPGSASCVACRQSFSIVTIMHTGAIGVVGSS